MESFIICSKIAVQSFFFYNFIFKKHKVRLELTTWDQESHGPPTEPGAPAT